MLDTHLEDFQGNPVTQESEQISAIYDKYPRKVGKVGALKAIDKAVSYLVREEKISALDARRKLYKATANYAMSAQGRQSDKTRIPHPATWFNRGSYLDDPQEWQHVGGFDRGNVPAGKADSNMGVLAKVLNRGKHCGGADEDGELPAGTGGRDNPQVLSPGA
jgi:hypothetical protein